MRIPIILLTLSLFVSNAGFAQSESGTINDSINKMYVGTYTKKEGHVDGKAKGIYLLNQNSDTGALTSMGTVAELVNPSFVKVGKMGKYLFAVSELGPHEGESGFIYSYGIQEDGSLREISKKSTGGYAPCHIALDRSGKFVFVSNYMGGVVMSYKINEDGSLSENQEVNLENPENSHAHSVKISGDNRHAYIADLGNDKIWIFNLKDGKLESHDQLFVQLKEGAGPRHMSFAKNGTFAYSMNELNSSISVFEVLKDGGLKLIQDISSLPESFKMKNSAADIHIHPSGKFIYASNRGHDSIAIFKIEDSGKLTNVDFVPIAGKTPRNFAISPYGKFLYAASQDTGNITTYRINPENGKLKPQEPVFEIKTPVCLEFVK
ncbi:lactonase family protein [Christiangramia sp. SM2212]|uniref:Lactonase family protein n=1 Tax=Christiangramia sediminicola TaxID=3073267 RepID=A0ABU1EPP6_9FLAO|nr:lactonase family protein [Christiangramia sp. SM2212]MDR5590358.1 lactonase family protein [Christiangramia sp. SM2212]